MKKLQMLQWLSSFQSDLNDTVWLDSGTLLGLVRDAEILSWDKDIDLGIWAKDLSILDDIHDKSKTLQNCTIHYKYYNSEVYHVSIENPAWAFPVHINVYREQKNIAYCAQGHSLINDITGKHKIVSKIIQKCFKKFSADRQTWSKIWPMNKTYEVYTWCIPVKYFNNLTSFRIQDIHFTVPSQYNEYLSDRYGDWNIPKKDWKYWENDNCIVLLPPEKAIH